MKKGATGSVLNRAEAAAIVSWLETEKDKLESAYKEPIRKIVAVVTPFKAQEEIIRSLAEQSPEAEAFAGMTIGTVHSLQGAQCPVVIFSSVNSPGDASFFYGARWKVQYAQRGCFACAVSFFWCSGI